MPSGNKENQERGLLGYLQTLPIVLAILSLLGELILQSTFVGSLEEGFSAGYGSGLLFSASGLTLFSLLAGKGMASAQGLTAIVNILLSLAFIFLSAYAIRGKRLCLPAAFLLYAADTILAIVFLSLSYNGQFVVGLSVLDTVLTLLVHVLGLFGLGFAVFRSGFFSKG